MKNVKEDITGLTNRIVKGTKIVGNVSSSSDLRIDGEVDGDVTVKGKLVIGKDGRLEGKTICDNADIAGSAKGNMEIAGVLSLKSSAIVDGDVSTSKLVIEDGAIFHANCSMKQNNNTKNTSSSSFPNSNNHNFKNSN